MQYGNRRNFSHHIPNATEKHLLRKYPLAGQERLPVISLKAVLTTHNSCASSKQVLTSLFAHLRIDNLPGFQVAKPAFKDWMVDNPDGQIAGFPVNLKSLLGASRQAPITPDTPSSNFWIWVQADVVHGAFVGTPLAAIASSWIEFWLR